MPFVKPDPELFANLFGSRATLAINLGALVIAVGTIFEGAYIVHESLEYYRPQDALVLLFPAFVMFAIRSRIFSYCFLALYIALSVQLFLQARSVYAGTYKYIKDPLALLPIVLVIPAICLVVYFASWLIKVAIAVSNED